MALGARPRDVFAMLFTGLAWMILLGGSTGILVALWLGRFAQGILYGVQARDPAVLGAAVAVLTGTALIAGLVPAYRASRIDPAATLRGE